MNFAFKAKWALTVLVSTFLLFGCDDNKHNWNELPIPDNFTDTDELSPLAAQNTIYTPNRSFLFTYDWLDSTGVSLYDCLVFNDACKDNPGVNCHLPVLVSEAGRDSCITCTDEILMEVFASKGFATFADKQTVIAYHHLDAKRGRILFPNKTGLIENDSIFFIHPAREFNFVIQEVAGMPFFKFPLDSGKTWQQELHIFPSLMDQLTKQFPELNHAWITQDFQVLGQGQLVVDFVDTPLECTRIRSVSQAVGGGHLASTTYFYHPAYGLVKQESAFANGHTLSLQLAEIISE